MKTKHILLAIPAGLILFGIVKSILQSTFGWFNQPILVTVVENYGWIGVLIVLIGFGLGKGWVSGIGALLVLLAVFFSGAGQWTRSTAQHVSAVLSCEADPTQPKCVSLAQKQAAQEARELAERVQKAAALAAAREAVEQARLAAIPLPTSVKGSPCSTERGKFKALTAENECRVVTFKRNEKYHFAGKEGYCPRAVPGDAGRWVHLGGTQYDFVPHRPGSTVTFYLQKKGETFLGNYCS